MEFFLNRSNIKQQKGASQVGGEVSRKPHGFLEPRKVRALKRLAVFTSFSDENKARGDGVDAREK